MNINVAILFVIVLSSVYACDYNLSGSYDGTIHTTVSSKYPQCECTFDAEVTSNIDHTDSNITLTLKYVKTTTRADPDQDFCQKLCVNDPKEKETKAAMTCTGTDLKMGPFLTGSTTLGGRLVMLGMSTDILDSHISMSMALRKHILGLSFVNFIIAVSVTAVGICVLCYVASIICCICRCSRTKATYLQI
jgi:hypothetical protein